MSSSKKIITVFCATGRQGRGAVKYLTEDGTFHVRAVTRNPDSDAAKALAKLGAEIVKGDLNDQDSILAAMKGAYGVFGITDFWQPDVGPREETQGKWLVDAAKKTGIQHLVWSTLDHSDLKVPHLETKANVDDYLKDSGVPRTSLYTVFFLENIGHPGFELKRDDDGLLNWTFGFGMFVTDGVISTIAASDVGAIAAIAFLNPDKFIGKDIFAATERITPRQLNQQLQDFVGETVKIQEITPEQYDATKEFAYEAWAMIQWFYRYAETRRSIPDTLAILPKPKTFKDVLEEIGKEALVGSNGIVSSDFFFHSGVQP